MGAREYSVSFAQIAVSAVQDLLAVYAGAQKAFEVHSLVIGQVTASTVQNLAITLQYLPATVTAGSGGSSVTPRRLNPGDAAATITARRNDTTQATTSASKIQLHADVWNLVNGYQWIFPERDRPVIDLSGALSLSLDQAPASAITASGTLVVAELF